MTQDQLYRKWARLYFEAAIAADERIGSLPGYEVIAPPPLMMNCAHAIELCIKAMLLSEGVEPSVVRDHNHRLFAAWDHLKKVKPSCASELSPEEESVLSLFSDSHEGMSFRYGKPPKSPRMPVFGPSMTLVEKFLLLCNAPLIEELAQ